MNSFGFYFDTANILDNSMDLQQKNGRVIKGNVTLKR